MNHAPGYGRPRPPDPMFNVDAPAARDAIIWVHRYLFNWYSRFHQSLFFEARPNHFVQLYTERRQQQIISRRFHRDQTSYRQIYDLAHAVVSERLDRQDDQMEFLNQEGQRMGHVTIYWEFPSNAFEPGLGTELIVHEIVKIDLVRDNEPNVVIMTLALDYPPIY